MRTLKRHVYASLRVCIAQVQKQHVPVALCSSRHIVCSRLACKLSACYIAPAVDRLHLLLVAGLPQSISLADNPSPPSFARRVVYTQGLAAHTMSKHPACTPACGELHHTGKQKFNKQVQDNPCNIWQKFRSKKVKGIMLHEIMDPDICKRCGRFRLRCVQCQKTLSANNIDNACQKHPCSVRAVVRGVHTLVYKMGKKACT
eukprot:364792-Chlamydomonas_euryale.AAC.8